MRYLKSEAPADVVDAVQQIEDRADDCFRTLGVLGYQTDLATWALLVGGIRMVEREIMQRGNNTIDLSATLQNVSRLVPIALKWVVKQKMLVAVSVPETMAAFATSACGMRAPDLR